MEMHNPPHPGEVLREYMGDVEVTAFAGQVGVSRVSMSRLLNGQNGVSARMAIGLAGVLGTSAEMWMNLQVQYELWRERTAPGSEKHLQADVTERMQAASSRVVETVHVESSVRRAGTKALPPQRKAQPGLLKTAGS